MNVGRMLRGELVLASLLLFAVLPACYTSAFGSPPLWSRMICGAIGLPVMAATAIRLLYIITLMRARARHERDADWVWVVDV